MNAGKNNFFSMILAIVIIATGFYFVASAFATTSTSTTTVGVSATVGGDIITGCTDTTKPNILSIDVTDISLHSVKITWTTDKTTIGAVSYALSTTWPTGKTTIEDVNWGTTHSLDLISLESFGNYIFNIETHDGSGQCINSTNSADQSFTTLGAPGLSIRVIPEKRYDAISHLYPNTVRNLATDVTIKIYAVGGTTPLLTRTVTTNDSGQASGIDIASLTTPGNFDIKVRGLSHLIYKKSDVTLLDPETTESQYLDFSSGASAYIKAGDINTSTGDNYINGQDIGVLDGYIFASDRRADLNADNTVNGADYGMIIANKFQYGD